MIFMMKRFLSVGVTLGSAALLLAGCKALVLTPNAIPKGYTYSHDRYKAPPSPEADDIGYEYSDYQNREVVNTWRLKAKQMADWLEENAEIQPKALFIDYPKYHTAQYATFDFALREELKNRGYTLMPTPDNTIALRYLIEKISTPWVEYPYPNDETRAKRPAEPYVDAVQDEMRLGLALYDGDLEILRVYQDHIVPTYGYEHEIDEHNFYKPIGGGRKERPKLPFFD